MKTTFGFLDPGVIMGAVVSLIILAVGVFAFFVTSAAITTNMPFDYNYNTTVGLNSSVRVHNSLNTTINNSNQVFNIVGVVMIIGAIMAIVGLVYNYVR